MKRHRNDTAPRSKRVRIPERAAFDYPSRRRREGGRVIAHACGAPLVQPRRRATRSSRLLAAETADILTVRRPASSAALPTSFSRDFSKDIPRIPPRACVRESLHRSPEPGQSIKTSTEVALVSCRGRGAEREKEGFTVVLLVKRAGCERWNRVGMIDR